MPSQLIRPTKPVKIAIRSFFVGALVLTAHIIKPFSLGNLTNHVLHSAASLSFVLPDQTRESFNSANLLAISLTNLFLNNGLSGEWQAARTNDSVLLAVSVEAFPGAAQVACFAAPRVSNQVARSRSLQRRASQLASAPDEVGDEFVALNETRNETDDAVAEVAAATPTEVSEEPVVGPAVSAPSEARAKLAFSPTSVQRAQACAFKASGTNERKTIKVQVESRLIHQAELEVAQQAALVERQVSLTVLLERLQTAKTAGAFRVALKSAVADVAKCEIEQKTAEAESENHGTFRNRRPARRERDKTRRPCMARRRSFLNRVPQQT